MSESMNSEAQPGNGLDSSAAVPTAEGSQVADAGQASPAESTQKDTPNWERRYSKLQAEYQPLRPWMDKGFAPSRVAELMTTFENVLKNPELGRAISSYVATGKVDLPAATPPAEDPYEDPSVKAIREELQATRAEIAHLRQSSQQTAAVTASERVAQLNEQFLKAYPELTQEESQEFVRDLMPKLDQMIQGNPAAFQRLDANTFEAIALPALNKVAPLRSLGQRALQQQQNATRQHATDAPLRVGTTGHEPPARQQVRNLTPQSVTDAMKATLREAFARTGRKVD